MPHRQVPEHAKRQIGRWSVVLLLTWQVQLEPRCQRHHAMLGAGFGLQWCVMVLLLLLDGLEKGSTVLQQLSTAVAVLAG